MNHTKSPGLSCSFAGILAVGLCTLFCLSSCAIRKSPKAPYESYTRSPIPDYSQISAWSSLPEKEDYADYCPEGASPEAQDSALADVFFIHPTTFMGGLAWNADIWDLELNAKTDERAIKHQASVFNRSCRVYVPRYRQMAFGGFFTEDTVSKIKALKLAYEDVSAAFSYYLDHYNQGRPIVIAGHSQGALHGIRIMKEFFDGKPLQDQLVAAYLAGWPFPADTFKILPVCNGPRETGCVMGWSTWKKGAIPKSIDTYYRDAVVTNPLNWRSDGTYAPDSLHQGFLAGNYKKIRPRSLEAEPHDGILWVTPPSFPLGLAKNYHVGDVNLFWLDIRANVAERVDAFIQSASQLHSPPPDRR